MFDQRIPPRTPASPLPSCLLAALPTHTASCTVVVPLAMCGFLEPCQQGLHTLLLLPRSPSHKSRVVQAKVRSPRLVLLVLLAVITLGLYGLLSFGYRVAAGKHAPPLSAVVSAPCSLAGVLAALPRTGDDAASFVCRFVATLG